MSRELAGIIDRDLSADEFVWERYEHLAEDAEADDVDWEEVILAYKEDVNERRPGIVFTKSEGADQLIDQALWAGPIEESEDEE